MSECPGLAELSKRREEAAVEEEAIGPSNGGEPAQPRGRSFIHECKPGVAPSFHASRPTNAQLIATRPVNPEGVGGSPALGEREQECGDGIDHPNRSVEAGFDNGFVAISGIPERMHDEQTGR